MPNWETVMVDVRLPGDYVDLLGRWQNKSYIAMSYALAAPI